MTVCSSRSCGVPSSFVHSFVPSGVARLLTVLRRASSHRQCWDLGLAQCTSPLTLGLCWPHLTSVDLPWSTSLELLRQKRIVWALLCSQLGYFVICTIGIIMINRYAKFEVPIFTHHGNISRQHRMYKIGWFGRIEVGQGNWQCYYVWYSTYNFLFNFNKTILYFVLFWG